MWSIDVQKISILYRLLSLLGEVAALNRRTQMLEEELDISEQRLLTASQKLDVASTAGDDSQRMCKVLENKASQDEARMEALENQLKDARMIAE